MLTDIRDYRDEIVDRASALLNRERNARRATVAELQSLQGRSAARSRPRSSATAVCAPRCGA